VALLCDVIQHKDRAFWILSVHLGEAWATPLVEVAPHPHEGPGPLGVGWPDCLGHTGRFADMRGPLSSPGVSRRLLLRLGSATDGGSHLDRGGCGVGSTTTSVATGLLAPATGSDNPAVGVEDASMAPALGSAGLGIGAASSFGPSTTEGPCGTTSNYPEAEESELGVLPACSWPCLLGIFQGARGRQTSFPYEKTKVSITSAKERVPQKNIPGEGLCLPLRRGMTAFCHRCDGT
jgi:hypothetical protein